MIELDQCRFVLQTRKIPISYADEINQIFTIVQITKNGLTLCLRFIELEGTGWQHWDTVSLTNVTWSTYYRYHIVDLNYKFEHKFLTKDQVEKLLEEEILYDLI